MKYLALPRCLPLPPGYPIYSARLPYTSLPYIFNKATLYIQQNGNLSLVLNEGSKITDLSWLIFNDKDILDISLVQSNVFWKASISVNEWYFEMCITKPCTHLHPAPSTSTQLISTSTQLHPAPPSSFQPPSSSLQHPKQHLNQNIARNWAISPNLGQEIKRCPIWMKIDTHGILEVLIPNPDLDF